MDRAVSCLSSIDPPATAGGTDSASLVLRKTKPPARLLRSHRRLFLFLPTAVCLLPPAFLCSRRIHTLQRDIKIESQIRHHVVVRLISTGGRERLSRHRR